MSRSDYRGATPETKAALDDCVKAVAEEMGLEAPQYLHAILAGKESDPFKRFVRLFRAVCRVNRAGARAFMARLNAIMLESDPRPLTTSFTLDAAWFNYRAKKAEREDSLCSAEDLERAKERLIEALGRDGVRMSRQTGAGVETVG